MHLYIKAKEARPRAKGRREPRQQPMAKNWESSGVQAHENGVDDNVQENWGAICLGPVRNAQQMDKTELESIHKTHRD
eukprot:1236434-Amphidinium_carterae.1